MSLLSGAFILCVLIGIAVVINYRFISTDYRGNHDSWTDSLTSGAHTTAICVAVVLVAWLVTISISAVNTASCKREADGYGLGYDWSIRNGCRIELPTGQLIPSDKIRITSDGGIVGAE